MQRINKYLFLTVILVFILNSTTFTETKAEKVISTFERFNIEVANEKPILEAKLSGSNLQLGKSIELTLTIKNKTSYKLFLFDPVPERSCDITVEDANEVSLPLTKEGRKAKYPNIIMGRESIYLEPGKELKLSPIHLDKIFAFKRKGAYTLKVRCQYSLQDTSGKNLNSETGNNLISQTKFSIK
jgi:hypothetical protein